MFFASRWRRQAEQRFTLCLSVKSFLQIHSTKRSWITNRNLWLIYLGKLGRPLRCLFFSPSLRQHYDRQHDKGTVGDMKQEEPPLKTASEEPLGGEDAVIWQKVQQQHSTVTSSAPCIYTECVKERTAKPQEPRLVLLAHSMLKCKSEVQ